MWFIARYCLAGVLLLPIAGSSENAAPGEQSRKSQKVEDFVFEVQPREIARGEAAVLHWSIKGATQVTIEESSESVNHGLLHSMGDFEGSSGTLQVRPTEDTTYVISCHGSTKYSCASLSLRVRVKGRR
jgi:hypothetical protein